VLLHRARQSAGNAGHPRIELNAKHFRCFLGLAKNPSRISSSRGPCHGLLRAGPHHWVRRTTLADAGPFHCAIHADGRSSDWRGTAPSRSRLSRECFGGRLRWMGSGSSVDATGV
jgi:hypothetical protein